MTLLGVDDEVSLVRYEVLLERSWSRLVSRVSAVTLNRADAEDAVAEAMIATVRRGRALRDEAALESYVLTAALRRAYRTGRRRRWERLGAHVPEVPRDPPAGQEEAAALLARVSPQQRAVLFLRYVEDLPEAEVAALLRVPVGTVRSRAARGRAVLREHAALDGSPPMTEEMS